MSVAWIYKSPMLGSLLLNGVILIVIITLLVTKLKAQNASEREQVMYVNNNNFLCNVEKQIVR